MDKSRAKILPILRVAGVSSNELDNKFIVNLSLKRIFTF